MIVEKIIQILRKKRFKLSKEKLEDIIREINLIFQEEEKLFTEKYPTMKKLREAVLMEREEAGQILREQKARTRRVGGALGFLKKEFDECQKELAIEKMRNTLMVKYLTKEGVKVKDMEKWVKEQIKAEGLKVVKDITKAKNQIKTDLAFKEAEEKETVNA
jgi:hypothetical protein